jgi:phosphoacetylglucosamine mutase
VRCLNTINTPLSYGFPSEAAYILKLAKAYRVVVGDRPKMKGQLVVDCANGVGTIAIRQVVELLKNELTVKLEKEKIDDFAALNSKVGR